MDRHHHEIMTSQLNRLLFDLGGPSVERIFSTSTRPSRSKDSVESGYTAISLAMEIAAFALRWATDLKQAVNTITNPVYSLPVEILQKVLEYVMDDSDPHSHHQSLHRLRSVSTRWCQTIDYTPTLWTVITAQMPPLAIQLAAQKSQGRHMSVYFDYLRNRPEVPASDIIDQMIALHGRWGSLSVWDWNSITMDDFLRPASPLVKALTLSSAMDATGHRLGKALQNFVLNSSTNLQEISISKWGFEWDKFMVTSVRSLTLSGLEAGALGAEDLTRMLSCCPQLEILHITSVILHFADESSPETLKTVHLPSLKRLSLDFDDSATIILRVLVLPPETRIILNGKGIMYCNFLIGPLGTWMTTASKGWVCPTSVVLEEDDRGWLSVSYGDSHFRVSQLRTSLVKFRKFLLSIDAEVRGATTKVQLTSWSKASSSSHNWMTLASTLFPEATHFVLKVVDATEVQIVLNELSTATSGFGNYRTKWFFPALQHITVVGPVSASVLLRFVSARIAGADTGEIARLVDITATELKGPDEERRSLCDIVTIIDR